MKLDIDFVRDLLLQIEAGQTVFKTASAEVTAILRYEPEKPLSQEDADKLRWHLDWAERRVLLKSSSAVELVSIWSSPLPNQDGNSSNAAKTKTKLPHLLFLSAKAGRFLRQSQPLWE
jgi:hypothetical protein